MPERLKSGARDWFSRILKFINTHDADIIAAMIMLFPICNLINSGVVSYYDEIIGCVSLIIILIHLINRDIDKLDLVIIALMVFITVLGLLGNIINQVCTNIFAIAVDLLWLWKTFAVFIAFKFLTSRGDTGASVKERLAPIAKIVIWFVFCLAVIGQFSDIGVTDGTLFWKIQKFDFFWHNSIHTGWLLFACVIILASQEKDVKRFYKYLILATVPMLLTGSSLVFVWLIVEYVIIIAMHFLRKVKKLKIWHIAIPGVVAVGGILGFAWSDITYYFGESARGLLLEKAVVIANRFFPLGSGFASYGSVMAKTYYSPLYVEFGWEDTWTLGRNGQFLSDNFFASILGQFGWIGLAAYFACLAILLWQVVTGRMKRHEKVVAVAIVFTIFAIMTGSASAKSMMGIFTFAILGLVCGQSRRKEAVSEAPPTTGEISPGQ